MSAPDFYTWDFVLGPGGRPARAASVDDLGGAKLRDDAKNPPIPPEMPYAAQLNQWALQLGGVNRIIPGLDLEVAFVAGNPVIVNATGMSDQITTAYAAVNFTLGHPSAGVVIIGWASGVLPPPRAKARASHVSFTTAAPQPTAEDLSNSVRVRTWNLAGVATDLPFVVSIL